MNVVKPWILSAGLGLTLASCGDAEPSGGQVNEAREVGVAVEMPLDATPSPTGDAVYFTAMVVETGGGVFKVGTGANGTPTQIASGLVAPTSLVMSTDGNTIYVADLGMAGEDEPDNEGNPFGVIYSVPVGGGELVVVPGTEGYGPRSLDLVSEDGGDALYFTGSDPAESTPGVYRVELASGALTTIYQGEQLGEPSGIAVTGDGEIFVADAVTAGGVGSIVKVSAAGVEEFAPNLRVGYPTGIALSMDDAKLLVSGLKVGIGSALVYRINTDDPAAIETLDMGIADNTESAGLHRAHKVENYAWADADVKGKGSVYLLGTKSHPLP